ncbi:hypothetical protein CCR95_08215 [Thiocystis minor]|nr:hypothetical protein [Thiocystis minor]
MVHARRGRAIWWGSARLAAPASEIPPTQEFVGKFLSSVGSWQLAVGSWQLAVGSWQLAVIGRPELVKFQESTQKTRNT